MNDSPLTGQEPPLVEPSPAPEVFVDGYHSSTVANGALKLTFFTLQYNIRTGEMERRVVLRLTTPLPSAVGISQSLGAFLGQIEQKLNEGARAQ